MFEDLLKKIKVDLYRLKQLDYLSAFIRISRFSIKSFSAFKIPCLKFDFRFQPSKQIKTTE